MTAGVYLGWLNYLKTKRVNRLESLIFDVIDRENSLVLAVDKSFIIIYVNLAWSKLGYSPKDMIGKRYTEFLTTSFDPNVEVALEKESVREYRNSYRSKNGKSVPLIWNANSFNHNKIVYAVAIIDPNYNISELVN